MIRTYSQLEKFFWKKFNDFIAEAAKSFVPYFEVLQNGFVKKPCHVFCS